MSMIVSRPSHVPASVQEHALLSSGWLPGAPAQIDDAAQAIDRRVCAALRCPSCRRRGLQYRPFQRGSAYSVLAVCGRCGGAETV